MITLTREQRHALYTKWITDPRHLPYREFRKTVQMGSFGCIMVKWCGMWLGIETDGYTHS